MSSKYNLCLYPNPIVKKVCLPLSQEDLRQYMDGEDCDLKDAIQAMVKVVRERNALGLAANQVGYGKRVLIYHTKRGYYVALNPVTLWSSKRSKVVEEACLSLPDVVVKVERPKVVRIQYVNEDREVVKTQLDGPPARTWQHEMDHLDGVLIIDKPIGIIRSTDPGLKMLSATEAMVLAGEAGYGGESK